MEDIFNEFIEGEGEKVEEKVEEKIEEKVETEEEKAEEATGDLFDEGETEERKPAEVKPAITEEKKEEDEEDFDTSDAEETEKKGRMIYADKGKGKTTLAFSQPGKIYCLSFDQKSVDVWANMFNRDERIKVKDGIRYLDKSTAERWLESADKSFRYLNHLLTTDALDFDPDWIVVDGTEIFVRDICEKAMRYREGLAVFQPFNLILWQHRNMLVDQIHMLANRVAKKGVIYTAYVNTRSLKIEGGRIIEQTREPKWAGDVEYKVDTVIRCETRETRDGLRFFAIVESSKTKDIETGTEADVFWDEESQSGGIAHIIEASR